MTWGCRVVTAGEGDSFILLGMLLGPVCSQHPSLHTHCLSGSRHPLLCSAHLQISHLGWKEERAGGVPGWGTGTSQGKHGPSSGDLAILHEPLHVEAYHGGWDVGGMDGIPAYTRALMPCER